MALDEELVYDALRQVYDPEIRVNIVDLGLVYGIRETNQGRAVSVEMTLTSPNCPVSEQIVSDVQYAVRKACGIKEAEVKIVWEPAWSPARMSEEARLELGYDL